MMNLLLIGAVSIVAGAKALSAMVLHIEASRAVQGDSAFQTGVVEHGIIIRNTELAQLDAVDDAGKKKIFRRAMDRHNKANGV